MRIAVSIVEDDQSARSTVAGWIRQARGFRFVSEYATTESALAQLPKERPDVVLVDINLPGQSGIDCVWQLRPLLPETQFLVLTVYEDADHIYDALAAGASGYLVKCTPRQELLAAIKQVHEGGSPMTGYIARKVVQSFQPAKSGKPGPEALSPREWEVLRLLARGYAYKEIADSLGISMPTVNTHIHRIYEKLHVRSRGEAVAHFAPFPERQPAPPNREHR